MTHDTPELNDKNNDDTVYRNNDNIVKNDIRDVGSIADLVLV